MAREEMVISKVRRSSDANVRRLRHFAKAYAVAWADVKMLVKGYPNCKRVSFVIEYERARERLYREIDRIVNRRS